MSLLRSRSVPTRRAGGGLGADAAEYGHYDGARTLDQNEPQERHFLTRFSPHLQRRVCPGRWCRSCRGKRRRISPCWANQRRTGPRLAYRALPPGWEVKRAAPTIPIVLARACICSSGRRGSQSAPRPATARTPNRPDCPLPIAGPAALLPPTGPGALRQAMRRSSAVLSLCCMDETCGPRPSSPPSCSLLPPDPRFVRGYSRPAAIFATGPRSTRPRAPSANRNCPAIGIIHISWAW